MSERILKALMRLFAIIAKDDELSTSSRDVVKVFLSQQLSLDQIQDYLTIYDEELVKHQKKSKSGKKRKRTSVNSVKVLVICTEINSELAQKQKFIVLLRLLEYIFSDANVTEQELEFVKTVAETFNITDKEYSLLYHFVSDQEYAISDYNENELLICPEGNNEYKFQIEAKGLDKPVKVIHIESSNIFFMKYFGSDELTLNGQVVTPFRSYVLNNGSSIRSNKVQPVYYSEISSEFFDDLNETKISYQVKDLEYVFPKGNQGLHRLNFREGSGNLVGIMGASGAGKSTLLNLLNASISPTSGEVLINGINIHQEKDKLEGIIGHISQDDLLMEDLTVYQNLYFNTKLCFDKLSEHSINTKVVEMLKSIGLYEIKDLKVGSPINKKISGGQRKRLNIALELIREPSVLFVDEPTSGLSSRDSENIMDLLNELALKGKLVFVVIHQPSSEIFKMFDNLLILDTGGYPIYYGNPIDSVIYFKEAIKHVGANESECPTCGNVNPELIFNIIETKVVDEYGEITGIRKVTPKDWNDLYVEKLQSKMIEESYKEPVKEKPVGSYKKPGKLKQLSVFIRRDMLSKLANSQFMLINFLEAPVLAMILAYLVRFFAENTGQTEYIFRFNENVPAFLFMSVVVALFMGLTVSAEEIISDQKILKREKFLDLSKLSYLNSKLVILFTISAIQTFSFVLIGNAILGIKGMLIPYWIILFTTSCFANVLGLNISASFSSVKTIYIFIPIILIPQLLLSGVIVKFDKLNPTLSSESNVPLAGELMTSRWAFEALATHQFMNNEYDQRYYQYDLVNSQSNFKKNFWIKELESRCNQIKKSISTNSTVNDKDWNLILKELEKENDAELHNLNSPDTWFEIDSKDLTVQDLDAVKVYLHKLEKAYIDINVDANNAKNIIVYNASKNNKESVNDKLNNYSNSSLYDLLRNKSESEKLVESEGELIQKSDPIYQPSKRFRAIFFAPMKTLFGQRITTFWANTIVIWSMTIVFFLILYFDGFLRLFNSFDSIKSLILKK